MPRLTEKKRRTIKMRFPTDPKVATQERQEFDQAVESSGARTQNEFIYSAVMKEVRRILGRKS